MKDVLDQYTGQEILSKEEILEQIRENDIQFVRLEWVDIHGISRGKLMPSNMIEEAIEKGIAFGAPILGMALDNTCLQTKGLSEVSDDMKVIADPSTFVILPNECKTAMILGDPYYKGEPMPHSPRAFLKKMVDEYHKMGLDPIAASEVEFYLYEKAADGKLVPYSNQTANCYTSNQRIDPKGFLRHLTNTFSQMSYNVLYMNHEFYPGQYEYNWLHSKAIRCADETTQFKSISKDIATDDNMLVTFMAKPKGAAGGSGCHFHISLSRLDDGKNAFSDKNAEDGLSAMMRHFVGGLLKHAIATTALVAPTVNCYRRFQPDSFAPVHVGWGYDNRTSYIRIPQERGAATRVEIRAGSAACNPYLALAGLLAAGLDGILHKIEPPEPIQKDLYHDEAHKTEALPRSLFRALDLLEQDEWIKSCMSEDLLDTFVKLKTHEVDEFAKFVTDWEEQTYSYHI